MATPTTVTQLRCPTALWTAMKETATMRGLSANKYVLRAIRAQMARDARMLAPTTPTKD